MSKFATIEQRFGKNPRFLALRVRIVDVTVVSYYFAMVMTCTSYGSALATVSTNKEARKVVFRRTFTEPIRLRLAVGVAACRSRHSVRRWPRDAVRVYPSLAEVGSSLRSVSYVGVGITECKQQSCLLRVH